VEDEPARPGDHRYRSELGIRRRPLNGIVSKLVLGPKVLQFVAIAASLIKRCALDNPIKSRGHQ
jgi:hypothetical protein